MLTAQKIYVRKENIPKFVKCRISQLTKYCFINNL